MFTKKNNLDQVFVMSGYTRSIRILRTLDADQITDSLNL